jgi:tetratricopeptide (TPR) repeat protein
MSNLESEFQALLQIERIDDLDAEAALNHLARLIDLAFDFKHVEGTKHALHVGEAISKRTLSSAQSAILNYYLSNAWANRRHLERSTDQDEWKWEQPKIETQIIHLRRALGSDGFEELHPFRQCQMLTNLGNLLNTVGRFVEAIAYWEEALTVLPYFTALSGRTFENVVMK